MAESKELQVLAEIPRGKTDVLRVTLDEFCDDRGNAHTYISLRVWYLQDGKTAPSKKGVTVRAKEILAVGKALKAGLDALENSDDSDRFARGTRMPTTPRQVEPPLRPGESIDDFGF